MGTTKRSTRGRGRTSLRVKTARVLLTGFCALFMVAGTAAAGMVFEETFDAASGARPEGKGRFVQTGDGYEGFTVERSSREEYGGITLSRSLIPRLKGEQGTIEFWLQRTQSGKEDRVRDPVLEFLDSEDRNFLTVYIQWEGGEADGGAELLLDGKRTADPAYDLNVWGEVVPLGLAPQVGEWVHVALTYGPNDGDNSVLVNGTPRRSTYPPVGSFAQTTGTALRAVTMKGGRLDLSGVVEVRVGAEGRLWDSGTGRGALYLENSVLDDLRFHDEIVTSFNLARIGSDGALPQIAGLEHDAHLIKGFSGSLVAGDTLTVSLQGTPGMTGTFDVLPLSDVAGRIRVSWEGYGVYLEDKVFFDDGEINLRDVEEYRVYASREPFGESFEGVEPVEVLEVQEQAVVIEDLERSVPYHLAVLALMDDGSTRPVLLPRAGLSMNETADAPGHYEGTFTVEYRDRFPEAVVAGHLSLGENRASLAGEETFSIDPSLRITVQASPQELEADEKSQSEVMVSVEDANGDPVPGHEIRFLLATTSQFTGVVGGGAFADEVGGELRRDFRGVTDLFGQATATYTSGFAAKTAIIVARDMLSNDTGAGYVKTFINATAELELEAVQQVAGKALGYAITVTSSDEWLTADGESTARITAFVTRDGIPVEGHRVSFRITSGTGSIRTVAEVTDDRGKARAVYTAGRKIGVVLITAVDQSVGISDSVQIELRSDAPAKIAITVTPDVLPADGRSTADIEVVVTDINDNPNEGVEVEYAVVIGSGELRKVDAITDRDGVSTAEYVAGRLPGKVSVDVTVRSAVPSGEELAAARSLAVAVPDYAFF